MSEHRSPVVREFILARKHAGETQESAADKMGVSQSLVNKVEGGVVQPTGDFLKRAAIFPPAPGYLERIRQDGLNRPVFDEWFRAWVEIEQQASTLRGYEPDLIPGLLQTEAYAMALLASEEAVAARLQRQEILNKATVTLIIAEHVLRWQVGGPGVMADQLLHLTTATATATVHILPDDCETYLGRDGSFILAMVGERAYVYAENPARPLTLEDHEVISRVGHTWDALAREALPQRQSRELILEVAEQWKQQA